MPLRLPSYLEGLPIYRPCRPPASDGVII